MVSLLWCSLFGISLILCQQKHAELCPTVSWKLGSCSAMSLVFNPRYVCFINRFMHMHHVFEVQEGIALHDPKLLLSGNSSPQKRKNYPEDIFIVTKKKKQWCWSIGVVYLWWLFQSYHLCTWCSVRVCCSCTEHKLPQTPARGGLESWHTFQCRIGTLSSVEYWVHLFDVATNQHGWRVRVTLHLCKAS